MCRETEEEEKKNTENTEQIDTEQDNSVMKMAG